MTVQTTSNLTNSLRTQYAATYLHAAYGARIYDQFAVPFPGISMADAIRGSSVQAEFLSGMAPGTTAISQVADVAPQILYDAVATVTPTSRGEALQWAEQLDIQVFTDYAAKRIKKIGENMMESVELLAQAAALQGTWVERAAARASSLRRTHRSSPTTSRRTSAGRRRCRARRATRASTAFVGMARTTTARR